SSNSAGVSLDNNDGATITFRGGLSLATTTNAGFSAINGGTIEVCDENPCNPAATGGLINTLTTTTGIALNVTGTTISANGLEFRSVNSNGASSGIVLSATGALGSLIVKGNGGSCTSSATCTGGAIQNATSHGISLVNTRSPSFTRIAIQNTAGSGIDGTAVSSFTLQESFLDNNGTGGGADESNIAFDVQAAGTETNVSGAVTITNNTLTNARFHGVRILNFNGTISDMVITGNTITSSTSVASSLGSGVHIQALGSTSTVSNVTKGNISNNTITNFPSDAGIEVKGGNSTATGAGGTMGTPGDATNIINITGNSIKGQSAVNRMGTMFIDIGISGGNSGSRSQANFNISNNGTLANPLAHSAGIGIGLGNTGYATSTVTTNNNFIVANNTVGSAGIGGGNGVVSNTEETPDLTWTINNNNISQTDGNGILAVARAINGLMKIKIQNNTVAAPLGGVRPGIRIDAGNNTTSGVGTEDAAVCLNISGNTSSGSGGTQGIGLRKQGTTSTVNDFGIQGLPGGSTATPNVEAYVNSQNPAGGGTLLISATSGFSTCSSAPLLLALGGIESAFADKCLPADLAFPRLADTGTLGAEDTDTLRLTSSSVGATALSQSDLDSIATEAMERWSATGLTAKQIGAMRELRFEVGDLAGAYLGKASGIRIVVDRDAQGKGWFIDPTPADHVEFGTTSSTTRRYTNPFTAAAGRIDLFTAIAHEIGHKLGLTDSYAEKDRDNLMYGYLTVGERRLPAKSQASSAEPGTLNGSHFLSLSSGEERPAVTRERSTTAKAAHVTSTAPVINPTCGAGTIAICLGTVRAGKTVNIQFKVTVNTPFPSGTSQVSNQGTVAFDGGGPVLTDDPAVGGANDPTVTPVQTCTPAPANMSNWWTGDTTTRDIAGGKDGTLNGAGYETGKVLDGFKFDGVDDYVDVGDVDLPGTFTIDAWVNPTNLTDERTIVNKDDGAQRSFFFNITSTGALRAVIQSGGGTFTQYQTGAGAVAAGSFQHVALTYDGAAGAGLKFVFYVNGALVPA
ncbi:MAG TPA: LamG-like jellyroll fold domain-containing protein, partial [Pyrinomonadaceae bacterium]|nr:LamG-like jellyroll fold domain-containing protein [Pyrinomonadaceae bacterium]